MSLEKILRYVVVGGTFLIPLIPFIVPASMFFPFISGKNFTFRILTEVIFAAWLVLLYLSPVYRPSKSSLMLWLLSAFVFIMALADAFGPNPFKSFWSNLERMEGWVTLIHLLMYFAVVSTVLSVEKLWVRLCSFSVAMSVIVSFYGLLQKAGKLEIHQSGTRLDATFGNSTYLAVYMIFHIFFSALLIAYARSKNIMWVQWLLGPVMILQTFILFFTETRGAVIGFMGGAALALFIYGMLEGGKPRKFALGGLAAIILLVGGFFLARNEGWMPKDGPLGRLATISLQAGNVRFMVWNMAWQGVKEKPVLGWGQDGFNYVFNKYYNPQMYAQEPWFDRVHNVFLDWLIAGGFLGLFAYLSLFGASIYYLWWFRKNDRSNFSSFEKATLTGLLAAYFVHNIFVFDNLISYILFASLLAYIFAKAQGFGMDAPRVDRARETMAYRMVLPIVIVALIGGVYLVNVKGILTSRTLLAAISPAKNGPEDNLKLFEKAYAYNSLGKQEVAEQFLMAAIQVRNLNIDDGIKKQFLEKSTAIMEKELTYTPNDARLLIFLASTYNTFGMSDKAEVYAKKALEAAPKKQYAYFELAQTYLGKGDRAKALELAKQSYELAPKYLEARIFYATMLIDSGRKAEAEKLLEGDGGLVGVNDDRVLNALVQTKQVGEVVAIWEGRVKLNPTDAQTHISLAASYLNAGRRADAIKEIQKAVELEPKFEEQGKYFISEIQAGRNP